jgi:hypothetical protein
MLKSYSQCCDGQSALCHTLSPHRLIPPPIKRSRILVSGGVVIVISVKLYVIKSVAAKRVAATFVAARTLPENSCFLTSSD